MEVVAGEALPEPVPLQHPHEEAQAGHRPVPQCLGPGGEQCQGHL